MSDRLVALALLAVSGVLFWQTFSFRRPPFAAFESFDAATFPRIVLALLGILSLALLVRGSGTAVPRVTRDGVGRWAERHRVPLVALALFAAYALLMGPIGWNASTTLYLVVMQLVILPRRGGRDLAVVIGGSLAFTLLLGTGFERFLHVVLPRPDLF